METVPSDSAVAFDVRTQKDTMNNKCLDGKEQADMSVQLEWSQVSRAESKQARSERISRLQHSPSSTFSGRQARCFRLLCSANDNNEDVLTDDLTGFRRKLALVIRTDLFDLIVMGVVILNFIFVVCDTELRSLNMQSSIGSYVKIGFLVFYCVELGARLLVDRVSYFADVSNRIDFAIVLVDVVSECLAFATWTPETTWMRLFRIMRVLRAIRRMKSFRELWLMLHGLTSAVKAMVWACILIFCVLVVWSLIAVEWLKPLNSRLAASGAFDGCDACVGAFDSVSRSTFTWFLLIFSGDLWADMVLPTVKEQPFSSVVFFTAFILVYLGLMNLILTVIVDRAAAARVDDEMLKAEEKKVEFDSARQKLRRLCALMDDDASGCVTLEELERGFKESSEFSSTLKAMDVAEEDLQTVFSILDVDKSGSVTYDEFVAQLHKIKTQEERTILIFIKHYVQEVRQKVSEQLAIIKSELVEKVDDHTLITNRLEERVTHAAGMPLRSTQYLSETDSMPKCHRCAHLPSVLNKQSFGAPFCFGEETRDTGAEHLLGQSSKLAWSSLNFGSIESRSAVALGEISSRMENAVCTEFWRLLERVEQAMSIFLAESAVQHAKHTESVATLEKALQQVSGGHFDMTSGTKIDETTSAIRSGSKRSPHEVPISTGFQLVPSPRTGPTSASALPRSPPATATRLLFGGQPGLSTTTLAGKNNSVFV
eukprot:TRINITY_DN11852_c0_g1_i1.p1 TRINITY_DN11852_c0_g1~~TRINITY_DN11852_c0_g1_i1.p1  ORF type:complete len:712 (+),score=80.60 TRINITY_DN11852_c0_g1_i1:40-2175(+)